MRILVVGGTAFVGRYFVLSARAAGHEATLLHRGRTEPDSFPEAEHLLTDRDGDLSALAGRRFDATVDVIGYRPGQVSSLARALDGRGGHHLFVSTCSVYAPPTGGAYTESAPLLAPAGADVTAVTPETYGPLKVACERAAVEAYGDRLVTVRPTYVVGPHDHTWRLPWWVQRIARGGEVVAPGPYDAPIQVIDARDQGAFMTWLLERAVSGVFHTVSPAPPYGFGDLLEAVAARVAPAGTTLRWVDPEPLLAAGPPRGAFPLWSEGEPDPPGSGADPSAAIAAGLAVRPLARTIDETWDWVRSGATPKPGVGLSPDDEAALVGRL